MTFPVNDRFRLAVHSENERFEAYGTPNESFAPNAPGSPVTLVPFNGKWFDLKVNFADFEHPAGPNYWTWVALQHQFTTTWPPHPKDFSLWATGWFLYWTPRASASGNVGIQFFYDGMAHLVELRTVSPNWGDRKPADPLVINHRVTDSLDYLAVNADEYRKNYGNAGFVLGETVGMELHGWCLLKLAVKHGLAEPSNWRDITVQGYHLGIELHNASAGGPGDPAGVAHARFKI